MANQIMDVLLQNMSEIQQGAVLIGAIAFTALLFYVVWQMAVDANPPDKCPICGKETFHENQDLATGCKGWACSNCGWEFPTYQG